MNLLGFEQGPIRPPSEAMSILVRVSRNCPWNRCAFCPVYKGGDGYSRRTVAEIHADLDEMREVYGDSPRTVFLQDADPLLTRPDDLIEVLHDRAGELSYRTPAGEYLFESYFQL